jgi:hypothetical protein
MALPSDNSTPTRAQVARNLIHDDAAIAKNLVDDQASTEAQTARDLLESDAVTARAVVTDQATIDMDTVTARLERILGGFKHEQKERENTKRTKLRAMVGVLVVVFIILGLGIADSHVKTLQIAYDYKVSAHVGCASRDEGRQGTRLISEKVLDDIVVAGAATNTPEKQAATVTFVMAERIAIEKALPQLNCRQDAPMPVGPRPSWSL